MRNVLIGILVLLAGSGCASSAHPSWAEQNGINQETYIQCRMAGYSPTAAIYAALQPSNPCSVYDAQTNTFRSVK